MPGVRFFGAVGLSAALATSPLLADEPAAAPISQICQLHVWPGNDLRSIYSGWFHGGIVDGAVQGRDGYRALPSRPLTAERQVERLRGLPIAQLLGFNEYAVVIHDKPLDSRTLRTTPGRLAPDTPPCYAELAVDDVFFQEDVIDGRFLKLLFRFRKFDGTATASRSFGTYIQRRLNLFPPKTPESDPQAGLDELVAQYGEAVTEFGQALAKPPKASRKRK
jgi:hypothetical protein